MTETEHMLARVKVDPETGKRSLDWRGLYIEGNAGYARVWAGHSDESSKMGFSTSPSDGSLAAWVESCLILVKTLKEFGAPRELHSIEDPDTYVIALEAYEANK